MEKILKMKESEFSRIRKELDDLKKRCEEKGEEKEEEKIMRIKKIKRQTEILNE